MHLLWAPRWVSRKVDALLEWPGCPGGGDVAHRKPGCRPPLAPPQTCRLLRLWPPLPQTRTRLLATHPSSIRAVCPCPHTLCVCSSPERIRASKSRAEGLGGLLELLCPLPRSTPSLPSASQACVRPQHPAAWTHTCSETSLVSESDHSRPCTQPTLWCSDSLGCDHTGPESLIPPGSGGWMSKAKEQAGSGPGESSPTDSTLILGAGSAHLSLEGH